MRGAARHAVGVAFLLSAVLLDVRLARGQAPDPPIDLSLGVRMTFYGDNTEFSNPFREGETLLGTFASVFLDARLSDRLVLRGGAFGHQRFGSDRSFDEARPIVTLIVGSARSRLILGTLETMRRTDGSGPDRSGPHGLLPPMQRDTLAFERPWEAGLQWILNSARVRQEAWLQWQRINTPAGPDDPGQRERFDAGLTSRITLRDALALRGDVHVVHQGGQLSANGPVADSVATALGVEAGSAIPPFDRVSLEGFALVSRYVPDREQSQTSARTGFGTFVRAAVEDRGWRAHLILWRGNDFVKVEGDPQYQSLRRDGTRYRGLRDYAEAGLTRTFRLASRSSFEASARWYRVEDDYEYSFRLLAIAAFDRRLTR